MKNLKTLIQELCPDGVEFVKLGDVCEIKTGKGITQKDCSESSKYPVYRLG
jgi:type I restriction enzyme S subunit